MSFFLFVEGALKKKRTTKVGGGERREGPAENISVLYLIELTACADK